eukprot:1200932-Rhodomonas_salina.1
MVRAGKCAGVSEEGSSPRGAAVLLLSVVLLSLASAAPRSADAQEDARCARHGQDAVDTAAPYPFSVPYAFSVPQHHTLSQYGAGGP